MCSSDLYYGTYRSPHHRILITQATGIYSAATTAVFLHHRPVLSLTGVRTVDGYYTWDVTGLHVDATTGMVTPLPGYPSLWGDLVADYIAGYSIIPSNIQQATRIMVQHLWATRRGLAGNLVTQQLPGFNIGYAIPQSVKDLLGPQPPVFA